MMFAFLGAVIGAISAGLPGFVIGGAIGYLATYALQRTVIGGLRIAQSRLVESTFSVMGAVCKADSVVTRDEINAVEQVFRMFNLQGEQRQQAKDAFSRGKQADFDLDAAVDSFASISRGRGPLVQLFLQVQCMAIVADGKIHPAEHAVLVRIAKRLGLSERDVLQLEALLRSAASGGSAAGGVPTQDRLKDAYTALGVTADSSGAEIKHAYRKLISANHPDKLASRGLPESMRQVAEERSREINSAYDLIKESRNDVK